ncbi:MAG: nucleic acid-binding protein [Candidatus Binatia bacterium]|nr:MAG: nucleic acid-binding protein [Candidatus Binatia bacterium]
MSAGPVVANSSPLIALERIRRLGLLKELFTRVLVPPAVVQETSPRLALPTWVTERSLTQPIGPQLLRGSSGPGESEAIALALETRARWLIMDDRPARRIAEALGLPVIGTLGISLTSKRKGHLPSVRPCLESLAASGFRISQELMDRILLDAGESA